MIKYRHSISYDCFLKKLQVAEVPWAPTSVSLHESRPVSSLRFILQFSTQGGFAAVRPTSASRCINKIENLLRYTFKFQLQWRHSKPPFYRSSSQASHLPGRKLASLPSLLSLNLDWIPKVVWLTGFSCGFTLIAYITVVMVIASEIIYI